MLGIQRLLPKMYTYMSVLRQGPLGRQATIKRLSYRRTPVYIWLLLLFTRNIDILPISTTAGYKQAVLYADGVRRSMRLSVRTTFLELATCSVIRHSKK
jgi:hypothetical protein